MSAMVGHGFRVMLSGLSIPGTENKQEVTANWENVFGPKAYFPDNFSIGIYIH